MFSVCPWTLLSVPAAPGSGSAQDYREAILFGDRVLSVEWSKKKVAL
jgi:hypothetical protein